MSKRRERRRLAGLEDRRRRAARREQAPAQKVAAAESSRPCPNCEPDHYQEEYEALHRGDATLHSSSFGIGGAKVCDGCGEAVFFAAS